MIYKLSLVTSGLPKFYSDKLPENLECYLDYNIYESTSKIVFDGGFILISKPLFMKLNQFMMECNCVVYYENLKNICNLTFLFI